MIQTLLHHFKNLVYKIGIRKPIDTSNQTPLGRWQEPPQEIIEKIIQHLDTSTDRIPLRFVSRSWRSVATQRGAPQLPWLVQPHVPNSKYLRFSSLSDGKVHKLRLPEQIQGGWYFGSSKGWLIMVKEEGLDSEIFLLNPISGDINKLPSFKGFVELTGRDHEAGLFFDHIELSSSDISKCMVAAVFDCELGLCRPGDKSWSVSEILDENEYFSNILFSGGMLYALVNNDDRDGVIVARTLVFEDHEMELKLVYDKKEVIFLDPDDEELFICPLYKSYLLESANNEILLVHRALMYGIQFDDDMEGNEGEDEGANNNEEEEEEEAVEEEEEEEEEGMADNILRIIVTWAMMMILSMVTSGVMRKVVIVILTIEIMDGMRMLWEILMGDSEDDDESNYGDDDDEDNYSDDDDGNGDDEECSFRIYKIGSEKDNLVSIDNLGDQILILADQGSSLSLSTSDFEELEGNCIYFGSDNENDKLDPLETLKPTVARDLDAFYLIDGAIEPSFPNLNMPIQLFTPIL